MFKQKITRGDAVRQKSTGVVLQAGFQKHDVWICHSIQTGEQHVVSINDVEKIKPEKPPVQTP